MSSHEYANIIIDIPQMIYPQEINNFLLPIRSDNAPINKVVIVAAIALNTVIYVIKPASLVQSKT